MFNNKLKAENVLLMDENALLRAENDALKIENSRLKAFIEKKQLEEKAEIERMKQMSNFWAYNGSVQIGGEEND